MLASTSSILALLPSLVLANTTKGFTSGLKVVVSNLSIFELNLIQMNYIAGHSYAYFTYNVRIEEFGEP